MNIIVAGGSGFVGGNLIEKLQKENNKVIILGRDDFCKSINNVQYISTDYSMDNLRRIFTSFNCNYIVNLASQRHEDSAKDSFDRYAANVNIAYSIFKAAHMCGIKNIINISSISTYSIETNIPWKENEYTTPKNWYGLSKLMIDNFVDFYNKRYCMSIKSLRLAQVIGYDERKGYMLDIFMERAYKKLPIIIYGYGQGKRQYIYIKDVVDCIYDVINSSRDNKGIYNVGMESNVSHIELAKIINKSFGNKNDIIIDLSKQEDNSINLMDINKIRKRFKWTPKWTLEEAFKDIYIERTRKNSII